MRSHFNTRLLVVITAALSVTISYRHACGQLPDLVKAAEKINGSVMTIRLQPPATRAKQALAPNKAGPNKAGPNKAGSGKAVTPKLSVSPDVTVCTGIHVGNGRIISSFQPRGVRTVRLTIPGGLQSTAQVRVIDEYSRLTLLQSSDCKLAKMELDENLPAQGSWLVCGSAWSTEEPVISHGIVNGRERKVARSYPPLLQCSFAVTETSSGAPVVSTEGKLVGVCVLAEIKPRPRFAYAVPVRHVSRLIRLDAENPNRNQVLLLENRRPVVGMVLGGNVNEIQVSRLHEKGPAEKAGIKKGDRVVAVDGIQIRSVYQALSHVMHRQAGDIVSFSVERDGQISSFDVTLAGGELIPESPLPSNLIKPHVRFAKSPEDEIRSRVEKLELMLKRYPPLFEFLQEQNAKLETENLLLKQENIRLRRVNKQKK